MKKEKIILVLNGKMPKKNDLAHFLNQYTVVFCADGAVNEVTKSGIKPHYIAGDLDSISKENKKNYKNKIVELNDQNFNDFYKILVWFRKKKISKINIIGIDGNRPDHMINNFNIIFEFISEFDFTIFTDYGNFYTIDKKRSFSQCLNKNISIFSPNPKNKMSSKGLKYELKDSQFEKLYSGTLNIGMQNNVDIKTNDKILIFISK